MRLVRYRTNESAKPIWGWLDEDKIGRLDGSPFGAFSRKPARTALSRVQLLPPAEPTKIICVGRNYAAHAAEHDAEIPELPLLFLKPSSSLLPPGGRILLPPQSERVEHEAELALVIGQKGRWIDPQKTGEYILGYTIANDVTARDLQRQDGQWTRSKGFDSFCPLGPWLETDLDPADTLITCSVNEQMRQMGSTRDMIFTVPNLVAYISSIMTLEPGDIILTGTPSGVGPLQAGDDVTVDIEGIGSLTNSVRLDPHRTQR
ncbi:MAG: FAA hydrolase family protein [Anaerolineales bacterium]|nr:MAG: FAA hydrolase family protein [Anaerolineales bacterium]